MALSAGTIIEAARYSHPSFDRGLVPASVAARFVNEAQRRLLVATHQREPTYLVRRWVIALLPGQNIAQVGAGTNVGAPLVQDTTALERRIVPTGAAATIANPANVYVAERAATAASSLTLTDALMVWTVDEWAGQLVRILSGTGAGQVRDIASNTADTLVVTEAWAVTPDTSSTYQVIGNDESVTGAVGIGVGEQPMTSNVSSWLVKLDAQGQPYLDLASPVQVPVTVGIPLPPNYFVNHGLVRFYDDADAPNGSEVLTLAPLSAQVSPPTRFCAAVTGQTLQLFRPFDQWRDVRWLEIPYLPLAPTVTGANDLLLLPEAAEEAMVARVAMLMGQRAAAMQRLGDPAVYREIAQRAAESEGLYLDIVAGVGRATVDHIRSVW